MLRHFAPSDPKAQVGPGRVAVIDIGSNSIRLVVYEKLSRSPSPLYNEKVICGLGRSLASTGCLNPQGVDLALANLPRFAALCEAMNVAHVEMLATAAVREAADGPEFAAEVERLCQVPVRVLSGGEGAYLAALGVISSAPHAHGVMGDLGGGSLELVSLSRGEPEESATLPLGPLRIIEESGDDPAAAARIIEKRFAVPSWLPSMKGNVFYAVGGAWRALARIHIEETGYPLNVIHHYVLDLAQAEALVETVSGLDRKSFKNYGNISLRRWKTVPVSAIVLKRLLALLEPESVVFSGLGLREGRLFSLLPESERRKDPLIAVCADLAQTTSRFALHGEELLVWMDPLFPGESEEERKLRLAACLLGDIAWRDHPEFRAELAYEHILLMPVVGIDHRSRIFLALAIYARYGGGMGAELVGKMLPLLDERQLKRATTIGIALRFAVNVSGGAPDVLARTRLELDDKNLTLILKEGAGLLAGEAMERSLRALAKSLGRQPLIEGALCRVPPAGPGRIRRASPA